MADTKTSDTDVRRMIALAHDAIIVSNAIDDPTYRPYCMRCSGMVRMSKVEPFLWRHGCGAEHDERQVLAVAPPPRLVLDRPSDDFDAFMAEQPQAVRDAVERRFRELHAEYAAAPPAEAGGEAVAPAARFPDDGNGDDDAYNKGWNDCRAFAIASKYAAPAAPVPAKGERIRQMNFGLWMQTDGESGSEPTADWKAGYTAGSAKCCDASGTFACRCNTYTAAPAPDTAGEFAPAAEVRANVFGDPFVKFADGPLSKDHIGMRLYTAPRVTGGRDDRLIEALRDMLELRACVSRSEIHPKGELNVVAEARDALQAATGGEVES